MEVILPEAVYANIENSLNAKLQGLRYARVLMSLASLLEEDFFNAYIKIGTRFPPRRDIGIGSSTLTDIVGREHSHDIGRALRDR